MKQSVKNILVYDIWETFRKDNQNLINCELYERSNEQYKQLKYTSGLGIQPVTLATHALPQSFTCRNHCPYRLDY